MRETLNAWAAAWAAFMWDGLIDATLLLAIVTVLWLPLRRRMSAQVGYCLFLLILVKLLVPIHITAPAWLANLSPRNAVGKLTAWEATPATRPAPDSVATTPSELHPLELSPGAGAFHEHGSGSHSLAKIAGRPPTGPAAAAALPLSFQAKLMLVWIAVVSALFLRFVWAQWRMQRLIRQAVALDPAALPVDFDGLRRLARVRQTVCLVSSPGLATPAVWGVFQPRLLLPPDLLQQLTANQLTWVLLHELAHIRRADLVVALVQRVAQILYFFHPAVWLVNCLIDHEREYACDDAALAACDFPRRDCGQGFLQIVERANANPIAISPALGLFDGLFTYKTFIRSRLMRILDTRRSIRPGLSVRSTAILLAITAVVLPHLKGVEKQQDAQSAPQTVAAAPAPAQAADGLAPTGAPGLELVLQKGHDRVTSVALSGDGKHVVTGSVDKSAILWEAASGKQLQTFQEGHTDGVTSVALSGDGKHVVTGARDKTAILWEAASGKQLQTFQGHTGGITSVALSGDGKHVATASVDKTAILWEAASGKQLQTFQGHTDRVTSVALTGDGKHVVTGSMDKTAILWEAASGGKLQTFDGHTDGVTSVALSGDGNRVVTGSVDKTAILWEASSGKQLQTLQGHTDEVTSVALSGDGKQVVTASVDKTAILWEAAGGKQLQTFQLLTSYNESKIVRSDGRTVIASSYYAPITSVALSGDGKHVVTRAFNGAILWEAASGKQLQSFQVHIAPVTGVALSVDGKRVVTGSWYRRAFLWDAASGKQLKVFYGHAGGVSSVALRGDGKHVITGSGDKTAILWEAATGKNLQTFPGHTAGIWNVALSGEGKLAVTGSTDGAIMWDAASGKQLKAFYGHAGGVSSVAMSGDGKHVVTGSYDKTAILWEAASGKQLQSFQGHANGVMSVALSGDGKHVVTGSWDRTAILWEAASGKQLQTFQGHTDKVVSVALSGDGKHVVTASEDETAILWEAASGKQLQTFRGHTAPVNCVALSGDGKHLWTTSHDGTTRLWDAVNGKERCRLYSFDAGKAWLVVTPEGLFDGSEGAWQFVTYRAPGTLKLVDDDASRRRFHRSGLLAQVWQGEK